jgi:hypothetical protein
MHRHPGNLAQRSLINAKHVATRLDYRTYLLRIHLSE